MNQSSIKTLSLTCPSCGGVMEIFKDKNKAVCPYCGHISHTRPNITTYI